jgi:post-segregation antitoxin (ccd killing protein)
MSEYDKPQGPKYKQVTVTVDPEVWRQLTERNKNMSAICRDALAAELQRCLAAEVQDDRWSKVESHLGAKRVRR